MLYIGLGAVAVTGAYILLKKERDDDNVDLKKGGYHPYVPASTKGGGNKFVPGHPGIEMQSNSAVGSVYWFPHGPGVACVPGKSTNSSCSNPPVYSAGNGAVVLSTKPDGDANLTSGDYVINGIPYWFRTTSEQQEINALGGFTKEIAPKK